MNAADYGEPLPLLLISLGLHHCWGTLHQTPLKYRLVSVLSTTLHLPFHPRFSNRQFLSRSLNSCLWVICSIHSLVSRVATALKLLDCPWGRTAWLLVLILFNMSVVFDKLNPIPPFHTVWFENVYMCVYVYVCVRDELWMITDISTIW